MRAIIKASREPGCQFVEDRSEHELLPGQVRIEGHNRTNMSLYGVHIDGAFAERVVVPAASCFHLPEPVSLGEAALMDSAVSAMRAVLRPDARGRRQRAARPVALDEVHCVR